MTCRQSYSAPKIKRGFTYLVVLFGSRVDRAGAGGDSDDLVHRSQARCASRSCYGWARSFALRSSATI